MPHLLPRAEFAVTARCPYAELSAAIVGKGWDSERFYSSAGTGFNRCFGVSFTPQQVERKSGVYNYTGAPGLQS